MKDFVKITGRVESIYTGPDGKIKYHDYSCNLVVKTGREHIIDRLSGLNQAAMSHMALGAGTGGVSEDDIALSAELERVALTSVTPGTGGDSNKITYIADFGPGVATGTVAEAGIFNSPSAGTMLCRVAITPRPKDAGDSVRHIWILTINS